MFETSNTQIKLLPLFNLIKLLNQVPQVTYKYGLPLPPLQSSAMIHSLGCAKGELQDPAATPSSTQLCSLPRELLNERKICSNCWGNWDPNTDADQPTSIAMIPRLDLQVGVVPGEITMVIHPVFRSLTPTTMASYQLADCQGCTPQHRWKVLTTRLDCKKWLAMVYPSPGGLHPGCLSSVLCRSCCRTPQAVG